MRKTQVLLVCLLASLLLVTGTAFAASSTTDTLKLDYFSNANTKGAPDGTLRITNPGYTAPGPTCADIYVYDTAQEMSECCSCTLTPNGLRTLSVNTDLTNNPLTGKLLTTGNIRIVSAAPGKNGYGWCSDPASITPQGALNSWATHIQNTGYTITESESQGQTLSSAEVTLLQNECSAIEQDGSGSGLCTCGTGD